MQYLVIAELIYASYTDIKYMETEPALILICMAARILEMIITGQALLGMMFFTGIIFITFLIGCICFSMGGADALIAALICIHLGFIGIYAVLTGMILALPFLKIRKRKEIPLIPFLSAGYMSWLILLKAFLK